jgi:hypothetical protein
MKTNKEVVNRLREFTSYNCNNLLDAKLCEDIRYLCDEVERFGREMVRVNDHMDADHITIHRYKKKLEKCQLKLSNYEPF